MVVVLQRVARERFEFFRQLFGRLLERIFSFLRRAAFAFKLRLQLRIFFARMFVFSDFAVDGDAKLVDPTFPCETFFQRGLLGGVCGTRLLPQQKPTGRCAETRASQKNHRIKFENPLVQRF